MVTHQASIAVSPSAFGVFVVTVLKMFTRTRNRVTRRAMRPCQLGREARKSYIWEPCNCGFFLAQRLRFGKQLYLKARKCTGKLDRRYGNRLIFLPLLELQDKEVQNSSKFSIFSIPPSPIEILTWYDFRRD